MFWRFLNLVAIFETARVGNFTKPDKKIHLVQIGVVSNSSIVHALYRYPIRRSYSSRSRLLNNSRIVLAAR